jgi:hypothetical protein
LPRANCIRLLWSIDTQGWNGNAARDYFINATRTMILIDKEGLIIGKPITLADLDMVL